ncbi:hypothetical protein BH11PSE14_BH11PSE14_22080 [soil metagenome]
MPNYGHAEFDHADTGFADGDNFVIQLDDDGKLWDAAHAQRVLDTVSRSAESTNTIVSVYVHGWHHNAAPGDADAAAFLEQLEATRELLAGKPHVDTRLRLTGSGKLRVIGIYVGWRGKSLPMPLDYLTFWGRKAAAERVGQRDLAGFMQNLRSIHAGCGRRRPGARGGTFMGLVSVGRGLGGQVLFRATRAEFEQQLKAGVARSAAGRRPPEGGLGGYGDLVVLLNPAIDALQYELIHQLNSRMSYGRSQPPRLLILSSANAFGRRIFFPLARWLRAVLGGPAGAEDELRRTALGEHAPHRTHDIAPAYGRSAGDPVRRIHEHERSIDFDLTNVPSLGRFKLVPTGNHKLFSPFLVGHADAAVIRSQGDAFEAALLDFVADYLEVASAKSLIRGATPEERVQAVA